MKLKGALVALSIGVEFNKEGGSLPKANLPGLKKEEVKVEIGDDRVLQISGERKVEKEKNDTWHRVERSSGKFVWRFRLPENAKMDGVKASMEIYLRCSSKHLS
ncbi:17.6 kDa class I heat shock protein-like [Camellia sinensis]|uniref:17.6 kDa class I heat shock protein-like n=1 Tax=Camellia sinensis TaxID=4442 RepID=UPI001035D447|nr:17.6 kDa class I heat shock protein-like [Camellia sinensis]